MLVSTSLGLARDGELGAILFKAWADMVKKMWWVGEVEEVCVVLGEVRRYRALEVDTIFGGLGTGDDCTTWENDAKIVAVCDFLFTIVGYVYAMINTLDPPPSTICVSASPQMALSNTLQQHTCSQCSLTPC